MRLSNRNKTGYFQFISTLTIVLFLAGLALFCLERYVYRYLGPESYFFVIIPTFILVIFYLRGRQIFEYDSDGEALNLKNRNVVLFLEKPLSDEFPKYKFLSYEIVNFYLIKKLYVRISSKKSNTIILKYDISYLTNKELNDLRFSLNKVTKMNRENKERENT